MTGFDPNQPPQGYYPVRPDRPYQQPDYGQKPPKKGWTLPAWGPVWLLPVIIVLV